MLSISKPSLSQFFHYCVEKQIPFAFYKLPNSKIVRVVSQTNSALKKTYNSSATGFLFAPFKKDIKTDKILIAPDVYTTEKHLPKLNFAPVKLHLKPLKSIKVDIIESNRGDYQEYIRAIQKRIKKGDFRKIVAARVALKKKPSSFSPVDFFKKLCKKYPSAFISLVYTQPYGLWIGASPEILLEANGKEFKTYSLAGTKANSAVNAKATWGEKEKQEQKIVSDYIFKAFQTITTQAPKIKGPETVVAGNLLHLRSTFTYKSVKPVDWLNLVEELHPTPAVAGLPKQKAISFISKNEKSARQFYSGYLGPVNLDGQINLFVNLRCMQVLKNKLAIYAGCGITADSNPADEWKESKMKVDTLASVL